MWFPQCRSPGGLEPRQCWWTQGHCIFMPKGKKITASKPTSFFFFLSEAVEYVCTMYHSIVRLPFKILKWSPSLKGIILKKTKMKEGKLYYRKGVKTQAPKATIQLGFLTYQVGKHIHLESLSPWWNLFSAWEDRKPSWMWPWRTGLQHSCGSA